MQKMILRITMILLIALSCSDNTEMEPSNFDYLFEETKFVVGGNEYRAVPNKSRAFIVYNQSMANKVMEVIETNNLSFMQVIDECESIYELYGLVTPKELQNAIYATVWGVDLSPIFEMSNDFVYCSPAYYHYGFLLGGSKPCVEESTNFIFFTVPNKYSSELDSIKSFCKTHNAIFVDKIENIVSESGVIACTNKTKMTAVQFAYLLYKSGYVTSSKPLPLSSEEPA